MATNELLSSKSGNLVKAQLSSDDGVPVIKFMFNPNELTFEGVVETSENPGARTQDKGNPKVSFSHVKAYKVSISKIVYDTYEDGEDVVNKYIEPFKKSVEFVGNKQRPPIYTFSWGDKIYLRRCFVEKLTYKLTLFLPNGTPVRAVIDNLILKEADERKPNASLSTPKSNQTDRNTDTPQNRSKAKNNGRK
jgi:Contractile injection system tube protein